MKISLFCILSLFCAVVGFADFVELEDIQGRVIKAKILNVNDTSVKILHENGSEYDIPFERLSENSRDFVLKKKSLSLRYEQLLTRKNRLTVSVAFNKRDKLDMLENFDDRIVYFSPKVKVANGDISNSYSGVKCTLAIIGESVIGRDARIVLSKQEFSVDLPRNEETNWSGQNFRVAYDEIDNGERFGYKLDGYILVIRNAKDEIVYSYASGTSWLKPEGKVFSLKPSIVYERTLSKPLY